MWNMNSGYYGYSMSNGAVSAYENGEKPMSNWTKEAIISSIAEIDEKKAKLFKKVTLPVLKEKVLTYSSWHHTSKRCNKTDFYCVDEEFIENISEEEILNLVTLREKKEVKSITFKGVIFYLEWYGTRNHPKASVEYLENVNIEKRGCFYYITNESGKMIRKKKINATGTKVFDYEKTSEKALEFYKSIKSNHTYSCSHHIYKKDRKPTSYEYAQGLDKFFEVGEHRLYEDVYCEPAVLYLETWDGKEWRRED